MRNIRFILLLIVVAPFATLHAQEVLLGVDFETYFDNKEYAGTSFSNDGTDFTAGTDFAVRIAPRIGVKWDEKNTLIFAVDMLQNFGEKSSKFLSEVKPVLYYQFQTPTVRATAGIFTRDMTHQGDYSTAFFSESYRFFNNRMNGVLAQYNVGNSYVEFICDWEGMYSTTSREKFRILSGGRHYLNKFYYGYNLTLLHFAMQKDSPADNVVDYLLINPLIGVKFHAGFDFDFRLGLLQTAQRDRSFTSGWQTPRMGEFGFSMSRWGFTLDEKFYFGKNLYPFFNGHTVETEAGKTVYIPYGLELYPGDPFFRTEKNYYNRAALAYAKSFFHDTLHIKAEFITHYDGKGLGTQQRLEIGVKLLKTVYNSKNHKK